MTARDDYEFRLFINYVTATEYLEIGQSEQRNQKGRLIELKDLID
jgi:hypothetical protein